ncbi:Protein of unknown function [Butyrivibrio sp. INlla14]|nr:DUF3592 domain-containing protein [Butyrivibrio sp. INlla14]SCX95409.1 Protein of unknown function [Butyrivibrio sp. INlla14]
MCDKVLAYLAIICAMCGFLYCFLHFLTLLRLNYSCTKKVVGELVDMEITVRKEKVNWIYIYTPVFRYRYNRHWYTSRSAIEMVHVKADKPLYRIGAKKAVYICPDAPDKCIHSRLRGDNCSQDMSIILGQYGAGLGLMLFLVLCFVIFR